MNVPSIYVNCQILKQKLHNLKNYYRLASNSPSGPVSVLLTETGNIVTYKPQN